MALDQIDKIILVWHCLFYSFLFWLIIKVGQSGGGKNLCLNVNISAVGNVHRSAFVLFTVNQNQKFYFEKYC